MTKFNFNDGLGLVPAHRHPNGGGWVADTTFVAKTAYVGRNAQVYGRALVLDDAKVYGDAQVFGHARVFRNAKVFGSVHISGSMKVVADVSETPVFIQGSKCSITTHDDGIRAGCLYMTDKEWNNTTDEEILDEYGKKYADDLEIVRTLLKQRRKS